MVAAGELSPGALAPVLAVLLLLAGGPLVLLWRRHVRALRRHDREVADLTRRLSAVLAGGRDAVLVHGPAGVVEANEAAAALVEVPRQALLGARVEDLPVRWISETAQPLTPATVFARPTFVGPTQPPPLVVGAVPASGAAVRWVQVTTRATSSAEGRQELVTGFTDMTGPREVRAALARSEKQFQAAMENAPVGMALLDPRWRLEQVNNALSQLLGADPRSLQGRDLSALSHPEDRAAERAAVHRLLSGEAERFTLEKRYLRSDGQTVWVVLDVVLVRTENGEAETFVAQLRDVTESRMQAELLAHRAMHDALTGLANRALMQETLERALQHPDVTGRVAVLLVDLDEFKPINDTYGHATGDEVLVHVAGVLRAATAGRGTVARLGGDEFVIVVEDRDAGRVSFEVAGAVHAALRVPVRTQRRRVPVHASIGVAIADPAAVTPSARAMLAAGDTALYRAKASGRSCTVVYDRSMGSSASSKLAVAAELAAAIEAGELLLHYQPMVDLATGDVVGHESLVRWQHPERGLLLPGAFLPTVTETGLGMALNATVVRQAVQHLARTADLGRWLSVNIAAEHLGDGQLVTQIVQDVRSHGIAPGRLVVELTEGSLGDPGSRVRQEVAELRAAGVPVLVDDFGTGAAPLAYLRDLPVDGVKLDMSYAAGIPEDPVAARVSRALGALAREMGMVTVAEGIETAEQASFMHASGWRYGQGWFFGAGQSEPVLQLAYRPTAPVPDTLVDHVPHPRVEEHGQAAVVRTVGPPAGEGRTASRA
ncbi:MAG: EAL domain-containing protein [Actinotalea sp.]|nr:EAL domain-containing protein [Actinotalea sp.]